MRASLRNAESPHLEFSLHARESVHRYVACFPPLLHLACPAIHPEVLVDLAFPTTFGPLALFPANVTDVNGTMETEDAWPTYQEMVGKVE